MESSIFQNNHALGDGGAIYVDNSSQRRGKLVLNNSELSSNSASFGSASGGAVYVRGAVDVQLQGGRVEENLAAGKGGGIFLADLGATAVFDKVDLSRNRARSGEGGAVVTMALPQRWHLYTAAIKIALCGKTGLAPMVVVSVGNTINRHGSLSISDTKLIRTGPTLHALEQVVRCAASSDSAQIVLERVELEDNHAGSLAGQCIAGWAGPAHC